MSEKPIIPKCPSMAHSSSLCKSSQIGILSILRISLLCKWLSNLCVQPRNFPTLQVHLLIFSAGQLLLSIPQALHSLYDLKCCISICASCVFHLGCTVINSATYLTVLRMHPLASCLGDLLDIQRFPHHSIAPSIPLSPLKWYISLYWKEVKSFLKSWLKNKPLLKTLNVLLKIVHRNKNSPGWQIMFKLGNKNGSCRINSTHMASLSLPWQFWGTLRSPFGSPYQRLKATGC